MLTFFSVSTKLNVELDVFCICIAPALRILEITCCLNYEVSSDLMLHIFLKLKCSCPALIKMRNDFLRNSIVCLLPNVVTPRSDLFLFRWSNDQSFDEGLVRQLAIQFVFLTCAQVKVLVNSFRIWTKLFHEVVDIWVVQISLSKPRITLDKPAKVFAMLIVAFNYHASVPRVFHV